MMNCLLLIADYVGTVPDKDCTFSYKDRILATGFHQFFNMDYHPSMLSYNPFGKPYLKSSKNKFFNISNTYMHKDAFPFLRNSDSLHTIAAGFAYNEIGIDIEYPRKLTPALFNRCFSHTEQSLIKQSDNPQMQALVLWTLKESYVKYLGIGIRIDLSSCSFFYDAKTNHYHLTGNDELCFYTYCLKNDLIVSICSNTPLEIQVQWERLS